MNMDILKRKLLCHEFLDKSTKKFQNQSISSIEDLSNEIFYEIFDYFNGYEIVQIFSNLNFRFQQFLHCSSLLIKTHFYLFHYEGMMNTFNELGIFSTKIPSNLKILSVNCSKNIIFLDAHRWEQIILNSYPQLEKFYFIYSDHNTDQIYSGSINPFSSSFWIQRKWVFKVQIEGTEVRYLVYPHRKAWHEYIEDKSIEYSTSTSLLTNFLIISYDEMLFEKTKHVLSITHIYHLNICQKNLLTYVLIKLMSLLPDLITLKLHSLSLGDRTELSVEELYDFCSMIIDSKIQRVHLEEMNDMQNFDCIRTYYPHMIHLKVKRLNNMNIQFFLRTILKKINGNHDSSLRSLCFHLPVADDQMIKNLEQMIQYEQLLIQFTIKCVRGNTYLQWK